MKGQEMTSTPMFSDCGRIHVFLQFLNNSSSKNLVTEEIGKEVKKNYFDIEILLSLHFQAESMDICPVAGKVL